MKTNRKLIILAVVGAVLLVLLAGAVAQAQPLPPNPGPESAAEHRPLEAGPEHWPAHRPPVLGFARASILSNSEARVENRVRGEGRTITIVAGKSLPLVVAGRAVWAPEAKGTVTLRLEVEQKAADGTWRSVGQDQKQETRTGPARVGGTVKVEVPFPNTGTFELRARVISTAKPSQADEVTDRDQVTFTVQVIDASQLGSMSGKVTAENGGTALEGIGIGVINLATRRVVGRAKTAAGGSYTIDKLRPGRYIVRAQPLGDSPYLGEFYDNTRNPREAEPITVEVGSKITGINFALAPKP